MSKYHIDQTDQKILSFLVAWLMAYMQKVPHKHSLQGNQSVKTHLHPY